MSTEPVSNSHAGNGHATAAMMAAESHDVVMECQIKELYYGTFKAVRDT